MYSINVSSFLEERENTSVFHGLVLCPYACDSWGLVGPKTGSGNTIQDTLCASCSQALDPSLLPLKSFHGEETCQESEVGIQHRMRCGCLNCLAKHLLTVAIIYLAGEKVRFLPCHFWFSETSFWRYKKGRPSNLSQLCWQTAYNRTFFGLVHKLILIMGCNNIPFICADLQRFLILSVFCIICSLPTAAVASQPATSLGKARRAGISWATAVC